MGCNQEVSVSGFFFFQAEDGIRDVAVTGVQRVLFRSLIEAVAWTTGIVLTRRITRAVADLYKATQFVKTGDLSHRIPVERPDQLGVLAESRSEEHTSELQSRLHLVCRLLLEKKKD